jgi:Transglycosylase SLT domain
MTEKVLIAAILVMVCQFLAVCTGWTDVYVHKDKDGILTFTNVPNHSGYRRVIREINSAFLPPPYLAKSFDGFILAVIKTESDFNANARSPKGAVGLMQLMPDTARQHNVLDVYNPLDNIEGGVRHLRLLLSRYRGDLELSLAAYNAGINAVERHGGIPPYIETREYVRRVLSFYDGYRAIGIQNAR